MCKHVTKLEFWPKHEIDENLITHRGFNRLLFYV